MQQILCIGSASKDIFFPTDEGVILETPEDLRAQTKIAFELGGKFRCKERAEAVGGVAANVAQGLARMGHEVSVYSHIGKDEVGNWIEKTLTSVGVETTSLCIDPSVKTDLSSIIVIKQTGDRIIFHNRDANEKLRVESDQLKGYDWFYVSSLNGDWQKNWRLIFESAEKYKTKIALNPGQHNLKSDPRLILESLPHVSALFLNKDEALELLLIGEVASTPEKLNSELYLIQALHGFGPEIVCLTDGKRGAWVYDSRELWHGDIYEPHGLVDTTGAGDAFGSGFFSAYLHHFPLDKCLRYGIANGGSVVGHYGAGAGLLDQTAAETYLPNIHTTLLANR